MYFARSALPGWAPLLTGRRMQRAVGEIQGQTRGLIEPQRANGADRGDLLSMLIAARNEDGSMMRDERPVGQSLSILSADHETTANALCWARQWHKPVRFRSTNVSSSLASITE